MFHFKEIALVFSVESRTSQCVNSQLQKAARKKLWALENDDKDICDLFKVRVPGVCMQEQERVEGELLTCTLIGWEPHGDRRVVDARGSQRVVRFSKVSEGIGCQNPTES